MGLVTALALAPPGDWSGVRGRTSSATARAIRRSQPRKEAAYGAVPRHWPTRIDERQRRALELGMIERAQITYNAPRRQRPPATLGHVGAASLPLQLALAARHRHWHQRWQAYELSSGPAPALITEHALNGERHSVVVTA